MMTLKIDSAVTKELIELSEKVTLKNKLLESLPKDELAQIHRYAWISMVGASTRIENAILTDSEVDWLDSVLGKDGKKTAYEAQKENIEDKLSKDRERSIEEVVGCRRVLLLVYQQAKSYKPLTESTLRGLHHELLRDYSKAGIVKGNYKETFNSVIKLDKEKNTKEVIFKTADPGPETTLAMRDLVVWYNKAIDSEPWPIAVACEFVYRFLAIHPFQDGNGRLGRALFLMSLLHCSKNSLANVVYYMSIDRHIEQHKEEYYIVLNQCSNGKYSNDPGKYKMEYFLKYMLKILNGSLADVDF
jgi:Fic family protein